MGKYQELTKNIPWKSFGRETPASRVAQSLMPVGFLPFEPFPASANMPSISANETTIEKYFMQIVGTAIQAEEGKLVTCAHVIQALQAQPDNMFLLSRILSCNTIRYQPYRITYAAPYYDPRTDQPNPNVDLSVLLMPIISTPEIPYDVPNVKWGDSTKLGVGDPVIVGGYPYGSNMFLLPTSNKACIQPTFYHGIISAIVPAMAPLETRLLQISTPVAGGMSGGAVFLPKTGEVVGLMTSCFHDEVDVPLPAAFAIPSEIIAPFLAVIDPIFD